MSPSRPWQNCLDIVPYFSKMCNCCRSVWVTVFCLKYAIIFATLKSCLRSLSVLLVMCSVRTAVKHALIPDSMQGLRLWVHFAADAPFLIIIVVPSWVQRGNIPLSFDGPWNGILGDMRLHCNQHHHDPNQVATTTEDPNKLYNTSMCGTANNRVINGQPVRMKNHQQYFHYIAQLWRIKLVKLSVT